MIRAFPRRPRLGDTVLLTLVGAPPLVAVDWSVSSGTLTIFSNYTDEYGRCSAKVETDTEGDLVVTAVHGA